jgi:hypothetical protein
MSPILRLIFVLLIAALVLSSGCGPTYLSVPPPDFDDYVESIPTPPDSVQLAEKINRWTSPREVCTGFANVRLYGTEQDYELLRVSFEQLLTTEKPSSISVEGESGEMTFVLSEIATVDISPAFADDPVALLDFDAVILDIASESYATLFILDVEHSYGDCAPNPLWP